MKNEGVGQHDLVCVAAHNMTDLRYTLAEGERKRVASQPARRTFLGRLAACNAGLLHLLNRRNGGLLLFWLCATGLGRLPLCFPNGICDIFQRRILI